MAFAGTYLTNMLRIAERTQSPPLLRSPFTGGRHVAVSKLLPAWNGMANTPERHREVCRSLIEAEVGGAFWLPPPSLPQGRFHILVLPVLPGPARKLWQQTLARHDANSICVLYTYSEAIRPLLEEVKTFGAAMAQAGDPHAILEIADTVYALDPCDLTALTALAGRPSFYVNHNQFHAQPPEEVSALISNGTSYANPFTSKSASFMEISEILGDWRRIFRRSRDIAVCTGMSFWKRRRIATILHTSGAPAVFRRSGKAALKVAAARRGAVAAWSTRLPRELEGAAQRAEIPLFRIEDGFIRSAGLGSGMLPPASIVVDRQGIYFDPSKPSDLEDLLAKTEFSAPILQRARNLIKLLGTRGVSKYATGGIAPVLRPGPNQRIILVPGQVADDLSVRLGTSGTVRGNLALLEAVRQRNPSAFIVYRPHPDVEAGHRDGRVSNHQLLNFADQIAADGSMAALIGLVDEVHTMTSLAGFEALLRGRVVETYGKPFYAGWGLTTDHAPVPRRVRRLQLEELVAATLILYPHYFDPATGLPCGPETLIARLEQAHLWRPGILMRLRSLQGQIRRTWQKLPHVGMQHDA